MDKSEKKDKKQDRKRDNSKTEGQIFKGKMDIVNEQLELLDKKGKLLAEEEEQVRKRKMALNCNFGIKEKIKKSNHSSLPYKNDFDLELKEKDTFLPTAVVRVAIGKDQFVKARAFMDTGAQPNGVTFSLFNSKLKETLNSIPMSRRMIGINGQTFEIRHKVTLKIHSWFEDDIFERAVFWIMPKDACWGLYMPDKKMNPFKIQNTSDLPFADPNYWQPEQVHLLFGVGLFARIIVSVIDRTVNGTAVMETRFGVIIFGIHSEDDLNELEEISIGQANALSEYEDGIHLDKLLERLWKQDQVQEAPKLTKEQMEVERHFVENFTRDQTGRFTVRIPLKPNITCFGSSREIALKRFMYLERKFAREPNKRSIYVEKMRESMRLGHMVQVTQQAKMDELVYHIPHHCIDKDDRVVFDASCKTDTGVSLNSIQMLGAKLQKDLYETIMRFRRHRVAVYADIRKMFNQVRLARDQWNLQRIFWRESSDEPLREYWLTVVIFGNTSSAYLAVRSVLQAASEAGEELHEAAKAIKEDYYMDDCVTGADTEEDAIKLANDMDTILKGAGFELRKWQSNNKAIKNALDTSNIEKDMLFKEEEESAVLGLKWLIEEDKFTFVVKNPEWKGKATKRAIASHVAQLYDPNGYINPITIRGRMLIQELWKAKVGWDEELEDRFVNKWIEIWKDIKCVEHFKIDRWLSTGKEAKIQIHGFSDSSESAYGANIYVRVERIGKEIKCNLLTSKSRVAPVKTVALPRLELTAAELLARLVKEVTKTMEWTDVETFLWIDSSVAYYWIKKEPCTLKTYVANRVASIQENTDIGCWRHIDGTDNPADLLTRGESPTGLIDNDLWLHGPSWIRLPQSEWPKSRVMQQPPEEAISEVKVNSFSVFRDPLRIGIKGTKESIPLIDH
ncbi:uncharacterized protein LOC129572320, partial [Sitodiplosis mosellana]|uniref:uncharacterized protein LOC129572320 n=1 Tax=Sitodiplosis mosellana TaxID=263140 RepID=UPI002444E220